MQGYRPQVLQPASPGRPTTATSCSLIRLFPRPTGSWRTTGRLREAILMWVSDRPRSSISGSNAGPHECSASLRPARAPRLKSSQALSSALDGVAPAPGVVPGLPPRRIGGQEMDRKAGTRFWIFSYKEGSTTGYISAQERWQGGPVRRAAGMTCAESTSTQGRAAPVFFFWLQCP